MTSKLQLDHFVIAVSDLAGAIADYSALGFNVLPGGKHQHAPTQNALVVFEDGSYFELIEWTQADLGDRWYRELSQHGEGLVDFALVPPDINEVLAQARSSSTRIQGADRRFTRDSQGRSSRMAARTARVGGTAVLLRGYYAALAARC